MAERKREPTAASEVYRNSGVTKGVNAVGQASTGAFPNLRREAFDQASAINAAGAEGGFTGALKKSAAGIRSTANLLYGLGQDAVSSLGFGAESAGNIIAPQTTQQIKAALPDVRPKGGAIGAAQQSQPAGTRLRTGSNVLDDGRIVSRNRDGKTLNTTPSDGFITGTNQDGKFKTVALGDRSNNPVNYVDMKGANAEFAEANRIRQQGIDNRDARNRAERATVGERIAYIPNTPIGKDSSAEGQLRSAINTIQNPFNVQEKNDAFRAAQLLGDLVGTQSNQQSALARSDATTQAAQIRAQQDRAQFDAEAGVRDAQMAANYARAQQLAALDPEIAQGLEIVQAYIDAGDMETAQDALAGLTGLGGIEGKANGGLIEGYADGGFVDPTMQRQQGTGAIGQFGAQGGQPDLIQQYQQYAAKATELNLPMLGYDEFSQMVTPQKFAMGGMVEGYSEGGEIDDDDGYGVDVSGKTVMDTDPNAPTDSIPAVIDGQRPAALDSGEFVIPKDVVQFYGTDKLSKMIEKARNPDGQNGAKQPAGAIAAYSGA